MMMRSLLSKVGRRFMVRASALERSKLMSGSLRILQPHPLVRRCMSAPASIVAPEDFEQAIDESVHVASEPTSKVENDSIKNFAKVMDPEGNVLPKASWIQVKGMNPNTSLHVILELFNDIVKKEMENGIIDLDAPWDPENEPSPHMLSMNENITAIEQATVQLSFHARPCEWRIKFRNRSVANAVLAHTQENQVYCSWSLINATGWDPESAQADERNPLTPFVLSESIVRFEKCPKSMTKGHLVKMLSRYELANDEHPNVIPWNVYLPTGKTPPPTFIVRFQDDAWARAAIRELQGNTIDGRAISLWKYPNQIIPTKDVMEEEESIIA